jgi:uncharacterized protein YtpQ (UPF0354 family)
MWVWLLVGWVSTSIVVAAVFHRRMRRRATGPMADLQRFLDQLAEQLGRQHPDAELRGIALDRDCLVLAIRGQQTLVPLQPVLSLYRTYPFALPHLVSRLLDQLEEEVLEQPTHHPFLEVFQDLMPQVRSRDWLRENGSTFGESALTHRALGDDLVVCYVIDDDATMVFVTRAHLKAWRKSEDDIHHIAIANLRRRTTNVMDASASRAAVYHEGDGFDAARVLLLDHDRVAGALVAMPDRDQLWVGGGAGDDLPRLMALTKERSEGATFPISSHVYRMTTEGLVRADADAED